MTAISNPGSVSDAPWLIVAGDFVLRGGMDRANYALAWHLAERRGRRVTLVAHRVAEPLASHRRVRVVNVRRPFGQHLLGQPLLDLAGRRAAARLSADHPHARIVVNGANCRWPGSICWVHMVHHACPADNATGPIAFRVKGRLSRWLFQRQESARLPLARKIIANSHKTRHDIVAATQVAPQEVTVCYLGCDRNALAWVTAEEKRAARQRLNLAADRPVLGFVGALGYDRNKGFDTLLQAVSKIQGQVGRRPLIVAAGGGQLEFWRRQAAAWGIADDTYLLGLIDHVPRLLASFDLIVSPTRYDAYGLAVHEAVCRGIPAIVSSQAGIAERYPAALRQLILSDAGCVSELAYRISEALDQLPELHRELAPFSERLRERSWDDMAADFVRQVEGESVAKQDPLSFTQEILA